MATCICDYLEHFIRDSNSVPGTWSPLTEVKDEKEEREEQERVKAYKKRLLFYFAYSFIQAFGASYSLEAQQR